LHSSSWHQVSLKKDLGDLDGIRGGALPQVVCDNPQVQSVRHCGITPDAADQDIILADGIKSQRHEPAPEVIDDTNARGCSQRLARLFRCDRLMKLNVHRL
jgi:hypothetical protein